MRYLRKSVILKCYFFSATLASLIAQTNHQRNHCTFYIYIYQLSIIHKNSVKGRCYYYFQHGRCTKETANCPYM